MRARVGSPEAHTLSLVCQRDTPRRQMSCARLLHPSGRAAPFG
jgi:hypothetical protein